MSIENEILLKGGKVVLDNLLSFTDSLVIKNSQEAEIGETNRSFEHFMFYNRCLEGFTNFSDHGIPESEIPTEYIGVSIGTLDELTARGDWRLNLIVKNRRQQFVRNYIDLNNYYATLTGKPSSTSQYIPVPNLDGTYVLYLHMVNIQDHPNTFKKIFVDNELEVYKNRYNFEYLKFMRYNLTVKQVRDSENFDILWYNDSILDDYDLNLFLSSYYEIRSFILENKYIKNLEEIYEHYSNFQASVIIFGTLQKFFNGMIDKFAKRVYTDKEIYDILDSHNLSSLKRVNLPILRRLVENIDETLSYRGTEYILKLLPNIVGKDSMLSIKRYDVVKTFKTNVTSVVSLDNIDADGNPISYSDNVDLSFIDRNIVESDGYKFTSINNKRFVPYDEFVSSDPTWGANGLYDSNVGKSNAIKKIKYDLLRMNFDRLSTKYLSVVNILNVDDTMKSIEYKLGLLIQYYGGFRSLTSFEIVDGVKFKTLDLFMMASYIVNHMKKIASKDIIDLNLFRYEGVMKLNYIDNYIDYAKTLKFTPTNVDNFHTEYVTSINPDTGDIEEIPIAVRNVGSVDRSPVSIMEYLTEEEVSKYVYSFNSSESFDSIMNSFVKNYKIFNKLHEKSMESNEYNKAMAWKTLYESFKVDIDNAFDIECFTYSEYFSKDPEMKNIFDSISTLSDDGLNSAFLKYFRNFRRSVSELVHEDENLIDYEYNSVIGLDLRLMVEAFVSIYLELRDVSIVLNMGDYPNNIYQLMDRYRINFSFKMNDYYNIREDCIIKVFLKLSDTFEITQKYDLNITMDEFEDYIIKDDKVTIKAIINPDEMYSIEDYFEIQEESDIDDSYSIGEALTIHPYVYEIDQNGIKIKKFL